MLGDILEHTSLFQGLTPAQLERIQPMFKVLEGHTGSILFEQGDLAEFLYLVVTGEVTVRYKPDDGSVIVVARVKPGGVVGWSAALGNRVYTSGAICTENSRLLRLRGRDLRKLCEDDPETGTLILDRLACIIAQRLSHTHEQVMALLRQGMHNGTTAVKGG